jgi:outer membrane protein assembly factor BamB
MDAARAYVPLQSAELVALDRETGTTVWSADVESRWPPLVDHGAVYAVEEGRLIALSAETGTPFWQIPLDVGAVTPLLMSRGLVVVAVQGYEIRAFRRTDGQLAWARRIPSDSAPIAVATDDTGVYVSHGSRLIRLANADGAVEWARGLMGELNTPTLAARRVLVGSTENDFYAFDVTSGRLAWRWRFGGDVVGATSDQRSVYVVALDNLLRVLKLDSGNQIWKRDLTTRPVTAPKAFGGIVVVPGNDPTLAAFDALEGTPLGSFAAQADLQGQPLIDSTPQPFKVALVVVTRDGRAIGLRPVGMMFREAPLAPFQALPGRTLERESRP